MSWKRLIHSKIRSWHQTGLGQLESPEFLTHFPGQSSFYEVFAVTDNARALSIYSTSN